MTTKTKKHKKLLGSIVQSAKHSAKLAIVPHKGNDYRPHLIRRYGLIAVAVVIFGMQLGYNSAKTGSVLGVESNITITSLLNQTNVSRQQMGLSALLLNEKLNQAAYMKAQDMFSKQYWAHNAPDGTEPWKWFADVGYNYNEAGENLAKNFTSTNSVMTAWLDSPEHKANILKNDYRDVGFAVVGGELNKKPATLVVALYGTPADSTTEVANNSFSKASQTNQFNIITQFAIATQSVTPAVMIGLFIIACAIVVAVFAHVYRRKLPKKLRTSWYRHHGIYKVICLTSLAIIVVFMYGGGQI